MLVEMQPWAFVPRMYRDERVEISAMEFRYVDNCRDVCERLTLGCATFSLAFIGYKNSSGEFSYSGWHGHFTCNSTGRLVLKMNYRGDTVAWRHRIVLHNVSGIDDRIQRWTSADDPIYVQLEVLHYVNGVVTIL